MSTKLAVAAAMVAAALGPTAAIADHGPCASAQVGDVSTPHQCQEDSDTRCATSSASQNGPAIARICFPWTPNAAPWR